MNLKKNTKGKLSNLFHYGSGYWKCSRLNHGDIVGSKQNAENFKKSVQPPPKVVVL
jgi:hypothetical protein